MRLVLEAVLSLLSVIGLLSVGWLCFGHLLTPAGNGHAVTVLPGCGDGEDLEQAVTGLLWLRGSGLLEGRVFIVDCGLTAEGLATAQALCRREPAVWMCEREELIRYIE